MRKFLALAAFTFATVFTFNANAQSDYDQVTLNVRLYPIQTIVVNAGQKTVNLDYITVENYSDGVSLEQQDHLSVYSTGGFAVNVKSSSSTLESIHNDVTENINASDIKVTPALGTSALSGSTLNAINLTDQNQVLISNSIGGVDKTFNITYEAAGADAYVNKYFDVENPTTYSTYVVYTIEAL